MNCIAVRRPWEAREGDVIVVHPERPETIRATVTGPPWSDGWYTRIPYRAGGVDAVFELEPKNAIVVETAGEVLLTDDERAEAAVVIETRGWHRRGYVPIDGDLETCPVCVLAALSVAAGHSPTHEGWFGYYRSPEQAAAEALADHLGYAEQVCSCGVVEVIGDRWNDLEATSVQQVTTALRECAAGLKAGA